MDADQATAYLKPKLDAIVQAVNEGDTETATAVIRSIKDDGHGAAYLAFFNTLLDTIGAAGVQQLFGRPDIAAGPYELVMVWRGHPRYEQLFGPLREDEALLRQMRLDAESDLDEDETGDKLWCVAVVDGVAAAWAAAYHDEHGRLRCCNSYERPGYRGRGLYAAAYRHRHSEIVQRWQGEAGTFVYDQPLARHQADGWGVVATGVSRIDEPDGDGKTEHTWYELRRGPQYNSWQEEADR